GDALDAQVRKQGGGGAGRPGLIHQAPAAWFATEVDVLRHGALGQQVELLEDRGHPSGLGLQWVGEADLPPLEGDRPAVGLVHTGQDLHHGGLAGPVLSDQGMHLPRMYHQVDPVQDLDPEEGLGDPLHLQDGPGRGCAHHATSTGVCERAECRRPSAIRAARRPSARVSSPPGRSLPIPASTRQLPSVAPAIWSSVAPAFLGVAAYFSSTATSLTAIDREGTGTSITCQPKVSAKSNNICITISSR